MKQIFIAFFALSVTTAFSGCSEPTQNSTPPVANESSQPNSDASNGQDNSEPSSEQAEIVYGDTFPEVLKVEATSMDGNKWRFGVTLSSPYDSPQRYADGWRVLDGQDQELGVRVLGHDHAAEQPFTRSHSIEVPSDTKVVFIEGRDQANGWSGQRFEYQMPSQR